MSVSGVQTACVVQTESNELYALRKQECPGVSYGVRKFSAESWLDPECMSKVADETRSKISIFVGRVSM